ncbi:MAG: hybrid sensor histidine kinase/response regulator [Idiomarina sp.]|nr:hybrid sensor histidine kinase/response regulator [Idiomarina sp.]
MTKPIVPMQTADEKGEDIAQQLSEARHALAIQAEEIRKLRKINLALIERVEETGAGGSAPYAAFEHAAVLAEQVRERTAKLSHTSEALQRSNASLRRANQAASLAHRRLVDAIESISDAFVLFDASHKIRLFNHRFREYWHDLGLKVEVGMPRSRLQLQAQEYALVQQWAHDSETRSRVYQLTNGRWIQLSERLTGDGGRVLLYTDITALKRSEDKSRQRLQQAKQAAEQANLSKTKFLAAVSHDLVQPLNAARLFHAAMQDQEMPAKLAQLVDSAGRSLADVEHLLRTLIDISKLDAGALQVKKEVVFLPAFIANLDEQHQPLAQQKQREFRSHAQSLWVETDPALLSRLLRNLLSNAFRYTDVDGRVVLGCRRGTDSTGQGYVDVQVLDNGCGFNSDERTRIFNEFHRLPGAHRHSENGLGLGLAIVERLSHLLEHPLQVRSTPGRGSCFTVRLPLLEGAARELDGIATVTSDDPDRWLRTQSVSVADLAHSSASKAVAVIDNDPAVCRAMQSLLEGWGYVVVTFEEPPVAPAGFDLIILDYHLHEDEQGQVVTGLDVLNTWQSGGYSLPPTMMITANHSKSLAQVLQRRKIALLHKPVRPAKLRALLQHLLNNHKIND